LDLADLFVLERGISLYNAVPNLFNAQQKNMHITPFGGKIGN
jgi:hypothetical protein